ncbi:MAG TPA: ComF family protein [Alphaproteobacteria bacterium]
MANGALIAGAGRLLAGAFDMLMPPGCMACRGPVDAPGRLCPACWAEVEFLAPPQCACCGLPFDYGIGAGATCAPCAARAPAFDRARAVMRYGAVARRLVVGLKHGDRTHLVPALGAWLVRAGAELLDGADALVPVPLHRHRLLARRFNQSALLARAAARATGVPVAVDALRRTKATPSQGGLSRHQRQRNVAGAFEVAAERRASLAGRRLVLVDDVFTTGATVEACARTLRRAGAGHVDVLTLARVVFAD